jgi:SAM-dependent methyltransferase
VLDIGFVGQTGFVFRELARRCRGTLVGLDIAKDRVLALKAPLSLVADGNLLPLRSECCDMVVLAEVMEHLYQPWDVIAESRRVLKPGGRLILTTPNPYGWTRWLRFWLAPRGAKLVSRGNYRRSLGDSDHVMFWEPLSLANALHDHGLVVEEMVSKNHRLPVLARHFGWAAAVDIMMPPFHRLGAYTCICARKQ